jgi:hypothetical protein
MNTNPSLTNPIVAATLTDEEWVALHVPRFAAAKGAYEVYETFL